MSRLVQFNGIKCDNPHCHYADMSVESKDYKYYLNRPCPMCGENLLTQDDYDTVRILKGIGTFFEVIGWGTLFAMMIASFFDPLWIIGVAIICYYRAKPKESVFYTMNGSGRIFSSSQFIHTV